MNQPTNPAELLSYLIALLAPQLVTGAIIRQFAEMLPFIKNTDETKELPPWGKFVFVYGLCLGGAILNSLLTGRYSGVDFGTAVTSTFSLATTAAAATQIIHFGPDVVTSFGNWMSGLFGNIVGAITKIIHPSANVAVTESAKG